MNIPQMLAYIPYMDTMGIELLPLGLRPGIETLCRKHHHHGAGKKNSFPKPAEIFCRSGNGGAA
jgi:hypothetical protein